tara:strand:+ start:7320 stop:7790 length:471 start_codon:yes stop_codon:yes gene_type:complete
MTLTPSTVSAFFDGFSVIGTEQNAAATNSSKNKLAVANNYLCHRITVDFAGTSYSDTEYIGLIQIKTGSTVLWNDVKVVVTAGAENIEGTVGYLKNTDAAYLIQGTLADTALVLSSIVPDPDAPLLEETQWLALQIGGTPPTSGKATFFVPYLATN